MSDLSFFHLNSYEKMQSFNAFGQKPHETDCVIHWTDLPAVPLSNKLRAAYELICAAGLEQELDVLIKAAVHKTELEAADLAAGESI